MNKESITRNDFNKEDYMKYLQSLEDLECERNTLNIFLKQCEGFESEFKTSMQKRLHILESLEKMNKLIDQ